MQDDEGVRRRATALLAVLAALAPLLCLRGFHDAANLPQSAWIAVAGGLWAGFVLARARVVKRAPPALLAAGLAWSGLSLAWAGSVQPGLRLWLAWLGCALLFVCARGLWRGPEDAAPVAAALLAAGALVAAIGLAQRHLGLALFPQGIAPAATFVNKNVAAGFLLLTWPLAWPLLRAARQAPARLAGLALVLHGLFLFEAFSRSAWLALAAQLLLALVWLARPADAPGGRRLALALALLALALAGAVLSSGRAGEALRHVAAARHAFDEQPSRDASVVSARGRLAVWANTLAMVADRPLRGVGLGALPRAYPPYAHARRPDPLFTAGTQLDFAHDDYLQAAAEQGLPGLALLLGLLAVSARALRRGLRAAPEGSSERRALQAVALVLVGFGVDAAFGFPLERACPPLVLALAAAAAGARRGADEERCFPRWSALPVLALALAQLAGFGRWLAADRQVAGMFAALAQRDPAAARRAAERALALDPSAFQAAYGLAQLSLDEHRPEEAGRWLDQALALRPHDPATLGTRALALGLQGDLPGAVADAQRVARLLPRDALAQHELGRWLERAGQAEEARQAYERACELQPARAEYRLRLAVSALRSGRKEQALEAGRETLRLDPRSALAHKLLGLALIDEPGRRAEALAHVRVALELDPGISDAARLRQLVEESGTPP